MQVLFNSEQKPGDYIKSGSGSYPGAPGRCPHKNCKTPKKLKKHGYYQRYLMTPTFCGKIRIRRYICSVCGRTVSMLPSFCISKFQFGTEVVVNILWESYNGESINKVSMKWGKIIETITRRNVAYYRARLRQNRKYIQYVLNQISPEYIELNQIPGDSEWTKRMLDEISPIQPHVFNAEFHNIADKSFMSPQNRVA